MMADRLLSRGAVAAVCLLTTLGPSLPTFGQSSSGMAGKTVGADPEVVNAAQAAEEALKSAATKGEATRGASGAIATLLVESDTLICAAWIISFRVRYRDMVLEDADPRALRAMQNLMDKVEKACEKGLNPEAAGMAGGAGPVVQTAAETVLYPECPECDPLKRALDQRTYEHWRAQRALYEAMKRTDFVDSVYKSNATPQGKRDATGGETPAQAERAESQKRAEVENAKAAMERANQALLECLERCHKRVRAQYGLFGGPRKKYAVGAGAVAAIGVVAIASSGGGSASASGAGGSPGAGPAPTPTPPPDPNSLGLGLCSGFYRAQLSVSNDRGGHRRPVGMPAELVLNVSTSPFQVIADPPWVNVGGTIAPDGTFTARGAGLVAGRPNVEVRMDGRLSGCSGSAGAVAGSYSMGVGGELPGGQSITYAVNGSK